VLRHTCVASDWHVVGHRILSFAFRSATEVVLKQQTMSASATTLFNCGVIVNPLNTVYDRDRIGNLLFTIVYSID
jgi:hypothetical protein